MEVSPALWEYLRPCALVAPPSAEEGGGATAFRLAPPLRQVSSPPFRRCAVGWGWGGVREDVMRTRPEQGIFS